MATTRGPHPRPGALVFCATLLSAALSAQTATVGVRIEASHPKASFWVDNVKYTGSAHFSWDVGSKHLLDVRERYQLAGSPDSRLAFQGWSETPNAGAPGVVYGGVLGSDPAVIITADPGVPNLYANFQLQHRVRIQVQYDPEVNLFDESESNYLGPIPVGQMPSRANPFGYVSLDGTCVPTSTWVWRPHASTVQVYGVPYPGNVFLGFFWQPYVVPGPQFNGGAVVVDKPVTLRARFDSGRRVHLESSPVQGLEVVVDRQKQRTRVEGCWQPFFDRWSPGGAPPPTWPSPLTPPPPGWQSQMPAELYCTQIPMCDGVLDMAAGSEHLFAAPEVQQDPTGKYWVFDHWDLGDGMVGGQNSVVKIPDANRILTYTARFVPGVLVNFFVNPGHLKLRVDGRDNWPHYNFRWGLGHKHTVEAPQEQVDARGRRWRFVRWSNDGPRVQEITVTEEAENPGHLGLAAYYELLGQVRLQGEVSSLTFTVDGQPCAAPCTLDRPQGAEAVVAVSAETPLGPDTKAVFDGWSDGVMELERVVRFGEEARILTARFRLMHKLTLLSDPEDGAEWTLDPRPAGEGWYPAGAQVTVTVAARRGFKFRRFDGVLQGTYPVGWLTMKSPATVVARFDRVPELAEAAVRNAAGETPVKAVAPGSLISILGYNLVYGEAKSPGNPLSQTLEGVVVKVGDSMLPLVSVSPSEIVALLYSDTPPGEHTVRLRPPDQPELTAKFKVERNAPGLFRNPEAPPETPLAWAFHEDGKPVTPENPARAGETVTLLGTGFGPVDPPWIDGFLAPASPLRGLVDKLELLIEGEVRPHMWAGLAPNRVGYNAVRFKVDPTMGQAKNVSVAVRVNGQPSNTVLLPLE